jgi:hypothetical protein
MAIENLKKHLILALKKNLLYNFGYICSQNGSNSQEENWLQVKYLDKKSKPPFYFFG